METQTHQLIHLLEEEHKSLVLKAERVRVAIDTILSLPTSQNGHVVPRVDVQVTRLGYACEPCHKHFKTLRGKNLHDTLIHSSKKRK